MEILASIEKILWLVVSCCYLYQIYYIIYMILKRRERRAEPENSKINKFGIIISARNEEMVIGHLIDSINKQNYPADKVEV